MKNLFLPYELAMIARAKGFNDSCVAWYDNQKNLNLVEDGQLEDNNFILDLSDSTAINARQVEEESKLSCSAPLYQQISDWLREKHNLVIMVKKDWHQGLFVGWECVIEEQRDGYSDWGTYKTYYEALNKAIEESFKLIK